MLPVSTTRPVTGDAFFDRRSDLETLRRCFDSRQSVALIGPRRIGKSSVAEEFLRRLNEDRPDTIGFRFEVHKNVASPSVFAVRLLRAFLSAYAPRKGVQFDAVELEVDPRQFITLLGAFDSEALDDVFRFLGRQLPVRGAAERPVLERVLQAVDAFGAEQGMTVAVILDEFQEILGMERYRASFPKGTLLGFWDGVTSSQTSTWFALTGSMVQIMERVLLADPSPLYGRYQQLRLRGFSKEDAHAYLATQAGAEVPAELLQFLSVLCEGHPYYLTVLGQRLSRLCGTLATRTPTLDEVRAVVQEEIEHGTLANHCRYILDVSLSHARRGDSLTQILVSIARSGETTAASLSRVTGQQAGEIHALLRNLVEVDLLRKEGADHFIPDRLFRLWLECVYGLTTPAFTRLRRRLDEAHEETIAKLRTERGTLVESAIRELLRRFDGREFEERTLPPFEHVEQLYLDDPEGVVDDNRSRQEVDAFCRGTEPWMVEIRWRSSAVKKRDLERFKRRRKLLCQSLGLGSVTLCVISLEGFTSGAKDIATPDMWLMDGATSQRLFRHFGMNPPADVPT